MKLSLLAITVLMISGCFTANREEQSATVREETRTGIEAGKQTNVHIVSREQTQTDAKTSAGVDVDAAIKAAVAAATGNISDLVASMKPVPQAASDMTGLIVGGITTLMAGGAAIHRNASASRKDKELKEVQEKYTEVCKQLPPERA